MACAYLSVAANLDPEKNILAALHCLHDHVFIAALSAFYRTAAIGRPEQPDYLNGVAKIHTPLDPITLKTTVLRPIETQLGRVRTDDRYSARSIDLDILLYEEQVLNSEELIIPDPDITTRPFLGAGLLDLNPAIVLPGDTQPLSTYFHLDSLNALVEDTAFTQRIKEQFTP